MSARPKKLTHADYVRLADFRYALRCFLEFSKAAAAKEGLTPQQHQALLVIRASPGETATVGRLAERLRLRHHSAVELAQRLEASGLITREANPEDRRAINVRLTDEGLLRQTEAQPTQRRVLANRLHSPLTKTCDPTL